MEKTMRLPYIDIFRGLALLTMITIQIFDYLSTSSIYTTPPYYVQEINSVTWIPPSLLFSFVSGMSVYMLTQKLKKNSMKGLAGIKKITKRYGIYIILSLPFTALMWNIETYLAWEEVIQGIGLSAIVTGALLMLLPHPRKRYLVALIIILAVLQSHLPAVVDSAFPQYPKDTGLAGFSPVSLLLNALFRGWFSVVNIAPIMLGGTLFIILLNSGNTSIKIASYSIIALSSSAIMHLSFDPINYYGRSASLTFFAIGESALLCTLLYCAYTGSTLKRALNSLNILGRATIFAYLSHYLLILKVLEVTGNANRLPDATAWILTIPLVILVYYASKSYLDWKKTPPEKNIPLAPIS